MLVTLSKEKETKNAIRFKEDGEDPIIGTLYVQKTAFETLGNPDKLTAEIKAA